jgi:predicted nucleic acid-binding protein
VPAVVDASALGDYVRGLRRDLPEPPIHVPALCDIEFASQIRRLLQLRRLEFELAAELVWLYLALPLTRHWHEALLVRVLELRDNFTAYDATYVALAERLDIPLLTADGALARAVQQHLPHVVLASAGGAMLAPEKSQRLPLPAGLRARRAHLRGLPLAMRDGVGVTNQLDD